MMTELRIYRCACIVLAAAVLFLSLRECGGGAHYRALESDFDRTAHLLGTLLDDILAHYADCPDTKTEVRLHDRYLRDGTFARVDSLDDRCSELLHAMAAACPHRFVPRLAERTGRHLELCAKANAAEMPYLYRMDRYLRVDPRLDLRPR